MDSDQVLAVIRRLPASQPLTNEYEALRPLGAAPTGNWSTQKAHLVGWLSELKGPGYYGRLTHDMDARAAYNHLQCAPALLWLAEALGEDPGTLIRAISAVRAVPRNGASQCAAVRREIPWDRIEQLILQGQRRGLSRFTMGRCQPSMKQDARRMPNRKPFRRALTWLTSSG